MDADGTRVPATLRECSVVIVGSTCRICGTAFKCESDVALHKRWRHNAALGSLLNVLDREISLGDVGRRCDVPFGIVSDLRVHRRLMQKHRPRHRGKRRKETVRVRFKLNGVTTTDVSLDRKYIKLQSNVGCIVDVCTRSPGALEKERPGRKDDCAGSIDLSFPNRVADKSHMQHGIRSDKAANRYIVGKFASTKDDAIASRTLVVGRRDLVEILNTPHKDVIPDSDHLCEGHKDRGYLASQGDTTDVFIKTSSDGNTTDIREKENSSRTNERERRNAYCQNEILFDNNKVVFACQPEKSDKTLAIAKENSWSSERPQYSIRCSDKVAGTKETAKLTNSFLNSVEIIINNGKNYDATKRLSPPFLRLDGKTESMKANSNVDDDVQEVLRITRGNAQSDINHESPNRIEREMLIQNTVSDTFTLPPQLGSTIYPERCDVVFTNFEPSNYPSFVAVTENDYQFLANSFNKKLGIYLEDLHHYGIRLYNDLPEINNNLEEYTVYAHQDFLETSKQSGELPYTNELKTNDNEVAVVLD